MNWACNVSLFLQLLQNLSSSSLFLHHQVTLTSPLSMSHLISIVVLHLIGLLVWYNMASWHQGHGFHFKMLILCCILLNVSNFQLYGSAIPSTAYWCLKFCWKLHNLIKIGLFLIPPNQHRVPEQLKQIRFWLDWKLHVSSDCMFLLKLCNIFHFKRCIKWIYVQIQYLPVYCWLIINSTD